MIIINPGSENKGGTFEQARKNAYKWLKSIREEYPEVRMTTHEQKTNDGDWIFNFRHMVTMKTAKLVIHGFTKKECDEFIFHPRVYWNGSSTADPKIEDWLTDEYKYRVLYEKK